ANALHLPDVRWGLQIISERLIDTAKKQNMEVHAWTINKTEDMKRLIDMGVEGIVTDYPDRLLKLLGRL
ncbi:glycerophosphodiester phosphodiesterase, partial [Candidatus Saccharibacteria bacterium]|nr:glycerophosphodiester phosphodiesterase [Candidatus Saccharibacteria bacterium]NIW78205.1 glycerophosphodiester phosphodiesterase [Calditrichia bacterium]